jgi:hypothetical protein
MRAPPLLLLVLILLLAGCDPTLLRSLVSANPPPPPTCEELAQQEAGPQNLSFETIARESVATQYWPKVNQGYLSLPVHRNLTRSYLMSRRNQLLPSAQLTSKIL